jgi:hypothetical protein
MLIHNYKNDGGIAESEREHLGDTDYGAEGKFDECETISDTARIFGLWKRTAGVVMKKILRIFGYREKQLELQEALQESCEVRIEAEERLKKLRTTLDGEDFWFSRGVKNDNSQNATG